MNAFTTLRRAVWSIILALCIVVMTLYFSLSQVLLSAPTLERIAAESNLAQTLRNEVILPKIINHAKTSQYAALLDEATITKVFNQTIPSAALEQEIAPVAVSLQRWLDSKEPDVTFSIDTGELSTRFANQLAQVASDKIAALPRCTVNNTISDAQNAVCRSGFVSQAVVVQTVTDAIKNDPSFAQTVITSADIPLPDPVARAGRDIPSYLNMFYAASIIAAGIACMITLWLLLKHRVSGIITIGSSLVLSAVALFVTSLFITRIIESVSTDPLVQQVARAASTAIESVIQRQSLILLAAGSILIVTMAIIKIILIRRRRTKDTMHFGH